MSRKGNKAIFLPENIIYKIENNKFIVKGIYGTLNQEIFVGLKINIIKNFCIITRVNNTKILRSLHGLLRTLIYNLILGVTEKFIKIIHIIGIGYKFQLNNNILILFIGYTHSIKFDIPSDLELILETPIKLIIKGINKVNVGLFAGKIKKIRPPEPYKGKGIFYMGEQIKKKIGKKGK